MFFMKPRKKFDVVSIKYFLGGKIKETWINLAAQNLNSKVVNDFLLTFLVVCDVNSNYM